MRRAAESLQEHLAGPTGAESRIHHGRLQKKHRLGALRRDDVGLRVINETDYGSLAEESKMEFFCYTRATGLGSTLHPFRAGKIDGVSLPTFEHPTRRPRRNAPVSVLVSSEDERYFKDIFGDAKPYCLREYW